MHNIYQGCVSATLIDLSTRNELPLTTRPGSRCLFAERIVHGGYEIGLRFDWSDVDESGDPTLDADFYTPGSSKPLRSFKKHPAHHTRKGQEGAITEWSYPFSYGGLSLQASLIHTSQAFVNWRSSVAPEETPEEPG